MWKSKISVRSMIGRVFISRHELAIIRSHYHARPIIIIIIIIIIIRCLSWHFFIVMYKLRYFNTLMNYFKMWSTVKYLIAYFNTHNTNFAFASIFL